ncbi:helix-turn-helix domain protein [Clostridium argentinense CDC 2741]|uniref:Helix-turn-helix domain protein n=1 Tax=Clostridium argentinense CDC 2741 TaxID=1418104 RepID=A0A0C1UAS3_9CLOT|nr:AraC family transcriptional regulator [Clostridium argentinense]ARC83862.1 AraC family transcriptional regulator [Clostridium argentinense]KIE44675.1 helix-turn-helix domain protein [Clostridium argentinense CDC 2741]NFF39770.1 helix-turn-helix transcriptional regulator [Clostridium argentinense]NFP49770.1 helix-turn-helix transcriptional regulator [Clostridium argentinense]NFP72171.1 helix-turn-helix transcriptional regulator [Clostridium argentinense]
MITNIYFPKQNIDEFYKHHEFEIILIDKILSGEVIEALKTYEDFVYNKCFYDLSEKCEVRSIKNHMISLSVLLCHNIIKKGISPYSAKAKNQAFIKLIENSKSTKEIFELGRSMIKGYSMQINTNLTQVNNIYITKALNYIHNNLGEPLTLEKVADHVHLSKCYFCTQFKKETQMCFTNYITHARIEKSKFLLSHSNKSILDIAILLGFNNQNYFTTKFKNFTGLTPKEFRTKKIKYL